MPLFNSFPYNPKGPYKNGHYNTIVANVFSKSPDVDYKRIRTETPDGDFIDLDYVLNGQKRLVMLCHGLEGSSNSSYIRLFSNFYSDLGWDILAINYRGCSGTMNRNLLTYNSGTTDDIDLALRHKLGFYDEIVLIGFSLGGNLILKYLGEQKSILSDKISSAIAISTPIHLSDSSKQLLKAQNIHNQLRFLWSLNRKIILKRKSFPGQISLKPMVRVMNLYDFDNLYTAPLFGYKNAEDYYASNQSIQWLDQINVPTLIINAQDDPFLGGRCYPSQSLIHLKNIYWTIPNYGGHVGFALSKSDRSWILNTTYSFIQSYN